MTTQEKPEAEAEIICNQVRWLERYFYELNAIELEPEQHSENVLRMHTIVPHFTYMLQTILIDAIYLSISRLLDPEIQGCNTNMSIEMLVRKAKNSLIRENAENKLKQVRILFKNGKAARDKLLAHNDHKTALEYHKVHKTSYNSDIISQFTVDIDAVVPKIVEIIHILRFDPILGDSPMLQKEWLGVEVLMDSIQKLEQSKD